MSERAYRIEKIVYNPQSSFDLWHDSAIMEHINEVTEDQEGIIYIPISVLEEILDDTNISDEDKIVIKQDVELAKKEGLEVVRYLIA